MDSIYDKINAGAYNPKFETPASGGNKRTKEEYEAYAKEQRRLEAHFWADLFRECKVDAGDPFVERMQGIAWQSGHSGGYGDVVSVFMDLMPLWELYQAEKAVK